MQLIKKTSFKNNAKTTRGRKRQIIMSEPEFKKVGTRTIKCKDGRTVEKNVYRHNENAKPVKAIIHV